MEPVFKTTPKPIATPFMNIAGFDIDVYLAYGPDEMRKMAEAMNYAMSSSEELENDLERYGGMVYILERNHKHVLLLFINDLGDTPLYIQLSVIAHEVGHCMLDVCKLRGYNPVEEQEPFCYIMDDIFKNVTEALAKKDDKFKCLL